MATFNSEVAGVWYRANLKSLVWYPVLEFANAGYQVPQTWAEMIALSDQMVTNGQTPWCIGIESGGATGWPGTDWVEDIMLRTTTPENYDRWTSGELNFTSLEVRDAFVTMGDIWFNEDYVLGGRAAITTTFFGDAPLPMFDNPPGCWLHRQASFIPQFFPSGAEYGIDYDYFYLPPIDSTYGSPVLVAGDIYGIFADRPEMRDFVAFLSTGESVRAIVEMGGWLSPHNDASLDWYPTDAERGYAEILANADTVRFDGSDLMPAEIGSGAFWQGIVDYVNGKDLDTILSDIDLAWP
jgi:alpha-glucoside transport system substrate-binding protein